MGRCGVDLAVVVGRELQEITRQALQLPWDERVALAETLLAGVSELASDEVAGHWRSIAEQRLEAYERGEVEGGSG